MQADSLPTPHRSELQPQIVCDCFCRRFRAHASWAQFKTEALNFDRVNPMISARLVAAAEPQPDYGELLRRGAVRRPLLQCRSSVSVGSRRPATASSGAAGSWQSGQLGTAWQPLAVGPL